MTQITEFKVHSTNVSANNCMLHSS